ncbi:GNAT family N-acetyltransferase [Paractinoplanes lichenicola]|uniref:GNAT family N-acetyltransferase n=1 Tax=Paractinoplanes lichenicola TaxID=2802976 RepID=A0ABS1VRC4_9ACTN|nr:GNAT family N-acetyltransferase [Actinoplanes lichenicola]MBL7256694.1 GNAT family N-acetyltransferase [Actinoplanes lichenicola]
MHPEIRAYRPTDLDAVYDICVRTADAGGDARGQNSSDRLVGDIFAAPYVVLEPETARILDDGHGNAVGYVVGTTDTAAFVKRYRTEWLPVTAGRYGDDPRDEMWLGLHHDPERMLVPELAGYPAHLHIDLLPEWQGRGHGRGLMWSFLAGLHAAGAPRVHLGVAPANTAAQAFYARLGFQTIPVPSEPHALYLGRETAV